MTQESRRNFLKTSAVSAVAITAVSGGSVSSAQAHSSCFEEVYIECINDKFQPTPCRPAHSSR